MQMNNRVPNSFVRPLSPKAQYQALNESLVAQVQDTRRNLLGVLKDDALPPLSFPIEKEEEAMMDSTKPKEENGDEECIKVYLKIRPFKPEEIARNEDKKCVEILSPTTIVAHAPPESQTFKNNVQLHGTGDREYKFTFSRVFAGNTSQKQFFDDTTQQFVQNLLLGQDALLFSYGVTNGGKTYTFQGTDAAPGLVPRSVELLFQTLRDRLITEPERKPKMFADCEPIDAKKRQEMQATKAALWKYLDTGEFETMCSQATSSTATFMTAGDGSMGSSTTSLQSIEEAPPRSREPSGNLLLPGDYRCSVWVSFYEIYNEQVYDLLVPFTGAKGKDRPTLKVSEDKRGNVYVKGANEYYITSVDEAIKLVMVGRQNLQNAATKLNYNSSRSHCIYAIRLLKEHVRADDSIVYQMNRLSFCDLAGSERTSKVDEGAGNQLETARKKRVKETGSINASLLTLGKCIRIIRWNQVHRTQPQIVPYRESKLTRLFQDFLGARAQTCMVVNINQCASCFDETLHVLRFSAIAKEIKTAKEPVLPPAVASPPALKFSLLWNEARDRKRTVSWATNVAQQSHVIAASDQSVNQPLPDEDDEEADDDLLDKTLDENNQVIQQYLNIIEDLKNKLIEEKKKNFLQEAQIREEVCNEYGKLYREMEQHYKDDKNEAVADVEELAENRLELYVQSARKRRRTEGIVAMNDTEEGGDDDAWVPAESLQAKEKECEDLRKEVQRLQNELAALTTGESSSVKPEPEQASKVQSDGITALEAALQKKDRKINDLEQTVEEAGNAFEKQQAELDELKARNDALEKELANLKLGANVGELAKEVSTVKSKRDENRDGGAGVVKATVPKSEDPSASESKTMEVDSTTAGSAMGASLELDEGFKLIELESKIFELERSLEAANQKSIDLQKAKEEATTLLQTLSANLSKMEPAVDMADLPAFIDDLKSKEAQLTMENGKMREELQKRLAEEDRVKKELEDVEKKLKETESELTVAKERADSLSSQKEALEATLRQNLEKMLEMQRKLKESEKEVVDVKTDKDRLSGEYEKRLEELNATVTKAETESVRIRDLMQGVEKDVKEKAEKAEKLEAKANELQECVKKMEKEKMEAVKTGEELAEKLKVVQQELAAKRMELQKAVSDLEPLQTKLKEAEEKVEEGRRSSLEEGNRLRQELEAAKTTVVNIKKEKLELMESMKAADDECKRLIRALETKEVELKEEKEKSSRLVTDMQKTEQTIQNYKSAMQEIDAVSEKYEKVVAMKKQELDTCQKEMHTLREKYEISEKNFVLEQKKSMRLKSDLDLKTELENKLRADLGLIQAKLDEKTREFEALRNQLAEAELKLQQASSSSSGILAEIVHLKSNHERMRIQYEKLQQDALAKDARLLELETRLTAAKKMTTDLQQAVSTKNKEVEELTRSSEESRKTVEQLEVRYRNAEDERSSLVETVRQLKAENEKLSAARLPPQGAGGGRRRGAKTASLEHDNAEEVEVTPMASKPQKTASTRKKASTTATDTTLTKEQAAEQDSTATGGKATRGNQRGKTSGRARKASDHDDGAASDTTSASLASGKSLPSSPKQAPKAAQRKTKATKEPKKDSSMLSYMDFPPDGLVSNTGRPQRKAAQEASDRMLALHEQFRTSGSIGTSPSEAEAVPTTSVPAGSELPLKKRRRELMKDPTVPFCSPTTEEKKLPSGDAMPEAMNPATKKLTPKKKK